MMNIIKKHNENIYSLKVPYEDVYTFLYIITTDFGTILYDCGSSAADVNESIVPALRELNLDFKLSAVFLSHRHSDHAGGLDELLRHYPSVTVYSLSEGIMEKFSASANIKGFADDDIILGPLRAVRLPGHTADSAALLDTRTGSLICGDSLQFYGLFGSGLWGANAPLPDLYLESLDKLETTYKILNIYAAHDYHPYGAVHEGRDAVKRAIDSCRAAISQIVWLIEQNRSLDNEKIAELYHSYGKLPKISSNVIDAIRKTLTD